MCRAITAHLTKLALFTILPGGQVYKSMSKSGYRGKSVQPKANKCRDI